MKKFKIVSALLALGALVAIAQQPFDLQKSAATALGTPVGYGSTPSGNALAVNAFITNPVTTAATVPSAASTQAFTSADVAATAATQVKASGGNVYGFYVFNPNTSVCYLQFYNSTAATLGTGALKPMGVQAGVTMTMDPGTFALFNLGTGISTGETTTATGATPCTTAMTATIFYQ